MIMYMLALIANGFHLFQNVEVEEERVDDRSVDDLLSFINGGDGGIWEKLSLSIKCVDSMPLFLRVRFLTSCNLSICS